MQNFLLHKDAALAVAATFAAHPALLPVLVVTAMAVSLQRRLLRLQPAVYERAFWAAPQTRQWLRRYDATMALLACHSITAHAERVLGMLSKISAQHVDPSTAQHGDLRTAQHGGYLVEIMWHGAWRPTSGCLHAAPLLAALLVSIVQLCLIGFCPRTYDRWRMMIVAVGRALRLADLAMTPTLALQGGKPLWHLLLARRIQLGPHPVDMMLRIVIVYSGSVHLILFNIFCLLPAAIAAPLNFLGTALAAGLIVPCTVEVLSEVPVLQRSCRAVRVSLRAILAWPPLPAAHPDCSHAMLEGMLCVLGTLLLGCLLPLWGFSLLEYHAKKDFVAYIVWAQRRVRPGANDAFAAAAAAAAAENAGDVGPHVHGGVDVFDDGGQDDGGGLGLGDHVHGGAVAALRAEGGDVSLGDPWAWAQLLWLKSLLHMVVLAVLVAGAGLGS